DVRARIVDRVDVGLDAFPAPHSATSEVLPIRREVLADGEVKRSAVGQRVDLLEDALAVGPGSDHERAMAILERGRHDLCGGGGAVVHQDHHGLVDGDRTTLGEVDLPRLAATVGGDDRSVWNEDAGDGNGLIEQPTTVFAEVEDQAARAG